MATLCLREMVYGTQVSWHMLSHIGLELDGVDCVLGPGNGGLQVVGYVAVGNGGGCH